LVGAGRNKVESFKDLLEPRETPPEPPDDRLGELDRWAMFYIGSEILPAEKQQALLDGLAELIAAIDTAKKTLPKDRGGRPRNDQLHGMIYELAKILRARYRQEGAPFPRSNQQSFRAVLYVRFDCASSFRS
jgi:hypothetical protein